MMEADHGSNFSKIEMGNLSVPPGYVSLTAFILKKSEKVKKTDEATTSATPSDQEPICGETKADMNGINAYNQINTHRPWINHKPEESHTQHHPVDLPSNTYRPKGTVRGCPNCSNCLKVTARWHPEDARREVLEEAPTFHPTEEEFMDTLQYIASIHSTAEPYGICRIVPPPSWKPPCFLEKNHIWEKSEFVPQIQRIDGHLIPHRPEIMASSDHSTKTKRRKVMEAATDSQLITCAVNNLNAEPGHDSELAPKFTLRTFKKFADEFKIQYFSNKDKNKIKGSDIDSAINQQNWELSIENIEGEYGRIGQNPTEEIEVLCSNTLEAGNFSSGFPTGSDPLQAYIYPEYLKSGWNLNNILSLPGSLLSFESSEASCNFVPRVHVGMCFSPLNWKVEEHQLYSLRYMHLGEPKVWYSVPGRFAAKFETIWKKYFPDKQAGQVDKHDNLVMQLSCSILKAEGIPVYRCVQYPREFVLVFSGAYNSGFDCGFNCSEAVSFAPLEWLLHGQNVVELYGEQRRKTIISYDKLLLGAAREAVRARWQTELCMKSTPDNLTCKYAYRRDGILTKALNSRISSVSLKRQFLCTSLPSQRMDKNFDATCKRECCICLCDLHLSAVSCSCSNDKFACLDHAKQFCSSCTWSSKTVLYRYDTNELNVLCQAVDGKLSAVHKWAKEDLGLSVHSVASKRSKQTAESVHGSTRPSEDLIKEPTPPTVLDANSKWKQKLQEISNTSERKQNAVASQVTGTSNGTCNSSHGIHSKMDAPLLHSTVSREMKAKEKMLGSNSATTAIGEGTSSAGIKSDMKALEREFTMTKTVEDTKILSSVSLGASSRYLSLIQEQDNMDLDVSSDSSSDSDDS